MAKLIELWALGGKFVIVTIRYRLNLVGTCYWIPDRDFCVFLILWCDFKCIVIVSTRINVSQNQKLSFHMFCYYIHFIWSFLVQMSAMYWHNIALIRWWLNNYMEASWFEYDWCWVRINLQQTSKGEVIQNIWPLYLVTRKIPFETFWMQAIDNIFHLHTRSLSIPLEKIPVWWMCHSVSWISNLLPHRVCGENQYQCQQQGSFCF